MAFYNSLYWKEGLTSGKRFFVAPSATYTVEGESYTATDDNLGTDPRRALLTADAAVGKCTASKGDVIVLLPGAHSWTATCTLDVAGVTVTGSQRTPSNFRGRKNSGGVRMVSTVTTAAAPSFTVTAADCEIAYLHITPAVGYRGISLTNAAADRTYIHDCTFSMIGTGDTNTQCIHLGAAVNDTVISNIYVHNEGSNGPAIILDDFVTVDTLIENSTFKHGGDTAWADAIKTIAVSLGNVIRDVDFLLRNSAIAITDGIDCASSTTDGGTTIMRCMFPVGCNLTNGNVADNMCAENYTLQAAASVGGTLILCT